jgi:hypothetical protein
MSLLGKKEAKDQAEYMIKTEICFVFYRTDQGDFPPVIEA